MPGRTLKVRSPAWPGGLVLVARLARPARPARRTRGLAPLAALLIAALPTLAHAQASASAGANTTPAAPSPQVAQLLSAARMWDAKDRPDVARGIVQKALLIDPQQPDALAMLGLIELRSNRPAEAAKILQKLRQRAPNANATLELADAYRIATTDKVEMANIRLLSSAGKSEEAAQRLQALFPRGAPRGALARDYYRILAGTPDGRTRVINELRARLKATPNDSNLTLILGDLLTDRAPTRLEGLDLIYRAYQRQDSNRRLALELWRRALNSAGRDDPAYLVWYQRYLQEVPDDTDAQEVVAAFTKRGGAPPSLAAGNNANNAPTTTAANERSRGLKQLSRGSVSDADATLSRAARKRASDGETIGALGLVRLREGRNDEARDLFARALKLDPDNAGKWRSLMDTASFWGTLKQARDANAQGKPAQAEALAREALRQQPDNADAKRILADALIAQQKWPEAEAVLRPLVNQPTPDIDALRSLVTVLRETHRENEIGPLITSTVPRVQGSSAELRKLHAELLTIQADQSIAENRKSPAIRQLEEAIKLIPDDAWTRYTLARQYRDLGLPALGRTVMEDGLKIAPSADMHYASALYLNSLDDIDAAIEQLDAIPAAGRSPGMQELAGNLAAQRLLGDARRQIAQGNERGARDLLDEAAAKAGDDPQMLASICREWITLGEPDRGLKLVKDWLDAHPDDPAIGVRLRYGELLAAAGRDDQLPAWIADARAREGVTPAQQADFDDQLLRLAIRETDRQIDEGDFKGAERTLAAVPAAQQSDRRWLLELADLREASGDYRGAEAAAREVLKTHPDDADARLAVARMLAHRGHDREAAELVREVLADTPDDDVDTRLSVARRFTALGLDNEAAEVVAPLRERYPERSDVTVQAGRNAQSRGDYNEAASLYQSSIDQQRAEGASPGTDGLTSAQRAFQALQDRRQGQVATELIQSNLSGDPGVSELHATTIPLYVRIPDGYTGHYFFHADTVYLNAGTFPGDDLRNAIEYGKIAALGNAGLGPINETQTGVSLAAGYEYSGARNSWRADLGSTPLGFPVTSVLGGFLFRHEFQHASVAVDVSRRPVTSSLVSYAGSRDPVTGEAWGGVVRNGFTVRGAQDIGPGSVFASVGFGVLTGQNVETNQEFKVRTGVTWPVFTRPDQIVTSGLIGNYWQYSKNEHFYTFGNGGYYSPQSYVSVGIPIDWMGRYKKLSWELEGSVGMSFTNEDTSPYFPTRPDLQQQAIARMAAGELGSPYFGGGSGGGFSYTLIAALEYRMTPHWTVGGRLQIDRSHDYAPNVAMAYLRYFFTPQHGKVPYPPTPVRPYSDY